MSVIDAKIPAGPLKDKCQLTKLILVCQPGKPKRNWNVTL